MNNTKLLAFIVVFAIGALTLAGADIVVDRAVKREDAALLAQLTQIPAAIKEAVAPLSVADAKVLNDFAPPPLPTPVENADAILAQLTVKPAAEFYVGEPAAKGVSLSPSGRYVAVIQNIKDRDFVVVYDLENIDTPQFFNFTRFSIHQISWTSDDRLLIGYSLIVTIKILEFELIFGGARMLAVNRDGSNPVILFGGEPKVAANNFNLSAITHLLPDDPDHILMPAFQGERLGVWKVNINDGAAELLELGNARTAAWFADKNGRPILRIDSNLRGTFLRIYTENTQTGDWRQVSSGPYDVNRTPNVWPAAASDVPGAIYVLANGAAEDRISMKLFETNSGNFLNTVFEHPVHDVKGAIIDGENGAYLGAWYIEDLFGIKFTDGRLQAHYNGLRNFFENKANVYVRGISGASNRFLVFVSGPEDPGDYYIYDYENKNIQPLFASRPQLLPRDLGRIEIINYLSRDGKNLTAYLTHPNGMTDSEQAPLIVMPHGGPESRDAFRFDGFAQFLASRGYRVLQPNYRGSSGYGKNFARSGYGEWGRKMQDDITDAVEIIIARGLVRNGEICIVGASYGGYAALVGAMKSPDLYRCAVSLGGVSDLPMFLAGERKEDGANSDGYQYWVRAIGHPRNDRDALIANSPRHHAGEILIPVLLVHGDADNIVPVEQSLVMRDALQESGKFVRYVEVNGAGHGNWETKDVVAYLTNLERFLDTHIDGTSMSRVAAADIPAVELAAIE